MSQTLILESVPNRQSSETMPEYAARVLRIVLTHGTGPLTLEQLEQADQAAQRAVASLPATLDPDSARLDATLHQARTTIQATIHARRARWAATARLIQEASPTPQDDLDAPTGPQTPQDDQSRAVRLLKAALILIMGQDGNPGHGARLQPRIPPMPPAATALKTPATVAGDGIQF